MGQASEPELNAKAKTGCMPLVWSPGQSIYSSLSALPPQPLPAFPPPVSETEPSLRGGLNAALGLLPAGFLVRPPVRGAGLLREAAVDGGLKTEQKADCKPLRICNVQSLCSCSNKQQCTLLTNLPS